MNIEFDEGESGFWEARALLAILRRAGAHATNAADLELIDFLKEAAATHMERPEFSEQRARIGGTPSDWPTWSLVKQFWRRTLGPSRLEAELSQQRSAALERAERAERSAFEALAETARVGRERDQARVELARLKQTLADREAEQTGAKG